MTSLEAEIIAIVEQQGLTVLRTHGEAHLLLEGNAFLNLTSVAKSLGDRLNKIRANAFEDGRDYEAERNNPNQRR